MATIWRRRQRCTHLHWLVLLFLLELLVPHASGTSVIQTMSSVLEEVLEHGPLFDEMEDEAWWSGVDVIDTALRSWPEAGSISDASALLALSTAPMDEEDFCRLWQTNRAHSGSSALPADACSLMNRALAVDLSGGSSSMLLLPRLPPPPPVPPTLTDLVKQLNQLGQLQEQTTVGNDDNCLLCQWATLNGTIDLLPNSGKWHLPLYLCVLIFWYTTSDNLSVNDLLLLTGHTVKAKVKQRPFLSFTWLFLGTLFVCMMFFLFLTMVNIWSKSTTLDRQTSVTIQFNTYFFSGEVSKKFDLLEFLSVTHVSCQTGIHRNQELLSFVVSLVLFFFNFQTASFFLLRLTSQHELEKKWAGIKRSNIKPLPENFRLACV